MYRSRFESRWLTSLSLTTDVPVMVLWGDSDSVARMDIAKSIAEEYVRDVE
jgi:pimeloyl-ACP methyl ester carboxylesterase